MAFLVLLESLSPVERAVFLLHDVFGYGYDEIAGIVGKSEANCRQLASRARHHVDAEQAALRGLAASSASELAGRFFAASPSGDIDGLVGAARGRRRRVRRRRRHGARRGRSRSSGATAWPSCSPASAAQLARARRDPAPASRSTASRARWCATPHGRLVNVFALDIADGVVQTVRSVINPDKLGHLGPLADVRAILDERRRAGP